MILTAFIGYVLPWGQMSLWGATVITSLASAIPVVGTSIMTWRWGGFAVDNPTLNRFYSAHYLLPFLLAGLSIRHLAALHQYGSTNPLGVNSSVDTLDFYPYYTTKDWAGRLVFGIFAAFLVFFYPEALGHPDNNIPANPYATPAHIMQEMEAGLISRRRTIQSLIVLQEQKDLLQVVVQSKLVRIRLRRMSRRTLQKVDGILDYVHLVCELMVMLINLRKQDQSQQLQLTC